VIVLNDKGADYKTQSRLLFIKARKLVQFRCKMPNSLFKGDCRGYIDITSDIYLRGEDGND